MEAAGKKQLMIIDTWGGVGAGVSGPRICIWHNGVCTFKSSHSWDVRTAFLFYFTSIQQLRLCTSVTSRRPWAPAALGDRTVCGHCPEWKGPSKSLWPALRSWKLLAPLGSVQREDKQRQAGGEGMLAHQALDTGRWVLFPR